MLFEIIIVRKRENGMDCSDGKRSW